MAINYTTLVGDKTTEGSIKNWVNRSDIPVTNILIEAEAEIYQWLRVREMKSDAAFQFDISTSSEALPSDFLDPIKYVPYEWSYPLPYYDEESALVARDSSGNLFDGTPSLWYIIDDTAYVDVTASANFGGRLMYYKLPAALSISNETNFLTTRYPSLLRHACMMKAYDHMKDTNRSAEYRANMMTAIQTANATNEMYRRGQYVPG